MDYIIVSYKNELIEGMYGQSLIWLLEILNDLQSTNLINDSSKLIFDVNAYRYDNIIPTFIVPKQQYDTSQLNYPNILNIRGYKSSKKMDFDFNVKSFETAHKIWDKYFTLSPTIEKRIPTFNSYETLGIHFRGTDKTLDLEETNAITQDEFIVVVKDYLDNNHQIKNLYCCSDEDNFINKIKSEFKNLNILQYDQKRATDISIALHKNIPSYYKAGHTIAAIVDMIALSRCKTILKTSSAMSAFAKIINPNVELLSCSATKKLWFPVGVVNIYKSSNPDVNEILNRTQSGHIYSP